MKLDRRSLILLLLQLIIVSSISVKYLYQRQNCPRVWTRAVAYDPELVLRGRYLSMQLHIDACGITLPPLSLNKGWSGSINQTFANHGIDMPELSGQIGVRNGQLIVTTLDEDRRDSPDSHSIYIRKGQDCHNAALTDAVNFYIPEHAQSPFPLKTGTYLWVEVTVPPKGPPRPINLAVNDNGRWQSLNF